MAVTNQVRRCVVRMENGKEFPGEVLGDPSFLTKVKLDKGGIVDVNPDLVKEEVKKVRKKKEVIVAKEEVKEEVVVEAPVVPEVKKERVKKVPEAPKDPKEVVYAILRNEGIRFRITGADNREKFDKLRKSTYETYPEDMLNPDDSINWNCSQVFSYKPERVSFWAVKVLMEGPVTIEELKAKVKTLCDEHKTPYVEKAMLYTVVGLAKGIFYYATPGMGTLKGDFDKKTIFLEYNPKAGRIEYRKFREFMKDEAPSTSLPS